SSDLPVCLCARVEQLAASLLYRHIVANEDVDRNSYLDSEDIMRGSRKLWILADVAAEVEDVKLVEVGSEMCSHAVGRQSIDKAVVGHQRDDTFSPDPVGSPSNGLNIRVGECVFVRCG